jgi:Asp/Glu/hydantoin racemase
MTSRSISISARTGRSSPLSIIALPRCCITARAGADAILVTGSLFGPAVAEGRKHLGIPVFTSFDGLIDAAFERGARFAALATSEGTNRLLEAELAERAEAAGTKLSLETRFVPNAMALVHKGDQKGHDRLVVEAAADLGDCDAILLGQFSMGPTRPLVEQRTGRPTLDAAEAAVAKLKARLAG